MAGWLWWAWLQIWPNLAANIIWVPVAATHHVAIKRHISRLHEQSRQHQSEEAVS